MALTSTTNTSNIFTLMNNDPVNTTNSGEYKESVYTSKHRLNYNNSTNNTHRLEVTRIGDTFHIRGILIKNAYEQQALNNGQPLKIKSFVLIVGSHIVKRVDIQMLNTIDAIEELDTNNQGYVYYNFEKSRILCDEIDIVRLQYRSVNIKIEFMNTTNVYMPEIECDCYLQYKYLSTIPRRELAQTDGHKIMHSLETVAVDNLRTDTGGTDTGGTVYLKSAKYFNGLYINGIDCQTIQSLSIKIFNVNNNNELVNTNGLELFSYDNPFEIAHFSTVLNNDTVYIPFNNNEPQDININSYTLSRDQFFSVTITTTHTEPYNVKYSIITQDKLLYSMGVATNTHNDYSMLSVATNINDLLFDPQLQSHVNGWINQPRLIGVPNEDEDTMCSVTIEPIEPNDKYIHCTQCNKNFKDIAVEWITTRNNCPHCRQQWDTTNYVVYINSAELVE